MEWLANGIQKALPNLLENSDAFDCAIYHLFDKLWILPTFEEFKGRGSIIYFAKGADSKSRIGAQLIHKTRNNISIHRRDAISKLMHDKFVVSYRDGHEETVLMGSTNFTPEAQTIQANLLHVLHSRRLADLYAQRAHLLAANKPTREVTRFAGWHDVNDIPGTHLRVFFMPEASNKREFLDTVTTAVRNAKSSVLFCMFIATDKPLMEAIFAQGDSKDHLIYGLLNSVEDPDKPIRKGKKRKLPEIAATIFHRSKEEMDILPSAAYRHAPRGFLPEFRTIDTSKYDCSVKKHGGQAGRTPPPIHIHHKFIVIDGETKRPTIYTGSPNFSAASEHSNDENVLEIKGNLDIAHVYVAEFFRLYIHYRARARWNRAHERGKTPASKARPEQDQLFLTTTNAWLKNAYKQGTKAYRARTRGLYIMH